MNTGMKIGADKGTVEATAKAILQILDKNAADAVLLAALEALTKISSVHDVTVSNCTFNGIK